MRLPPATVMAALLIAPLAALTAGCTNPRAGTPAAASESTSAPSSTVATATTTPAARPRPLDLTGADPCKLLGPEQLTKLGVDRPSRPMTAGGGSLLAGSPECAFGNDTEETGFLLIAGTTIGLPEFLSKISANPARRTITVAGFPATEEEGPTSMPERGSGECFVHVDVADGQLLGVEFSQIAASQEKRLPVENLCAKAREVAEAALTTLQGG